MPDSRREKQHLQNKGRADKMHAARLLHESAGEKSLADFPLSTNYHVGCSGWFYWDWQGIFYARELSTSQWFDYYASQFETVELNAPFYSWPTVATVKSWIRQASRKPFLYTVKVNELITHSKRFVGTKQLVRDFGYIADLLGPCMGCFLYQLPPGYHYTPARLNHIVSQIDPVRRNVVEFRHASWWNEDVYAAFREAGIIFCSCSAPKLPNDLVKTADDIYIRFHGTEKWYRHLYSDEELTDWAVRARESGAKQVWAYFNNDYEGFAIKNAHSFLKLLKSYSLKRIPA